MQADIKAIAEMMNEEAESVKKIAEEAKAELDAAEEEARLQEADSGLHTIGLDVVTEIYDSKGNYVGDRDEKQVKEWLDGIAKEYGVQYKILTMHGPGGGWPFIQFIGKKDQLKDLIVKWYNGGDEDTWEEYAAYVDAAEEEQLDEATPMVTVDDKYIKTALSGLASLKKTNPHAYEMAEKYLNSNKGRQLIAVEDFIKRRLELANAKSEPADTRSAEERRADAIASVQNSWDDFKKRQKDELAAKREQKIKSVWIKNIKETGGKTEAEIEITDISGKKTTEKQDCSVDPSDKYYKQVIQGIRQGGKFKKVTKFDVIISMYHIAFNDDRIQWFYGPKKESQEAWLHADAIKKGRKSWVDKVDPRGCVIYKNGSTTIYRNEDDMLDGRTHNAHIDEADADPEEAYKEAVAMEFSVAQEFVEQHSDEFDQVRKAIASNKKAVEAFDQLIKFIEDKAIGEAELDEARKSPLNTLLRGVYRVLCWAIKLTGHAGKLSGKVIEWLSQVIINSAERLDKMVKDSEDDKAEG